MFKIIVTSTRYWYSVFVLGLIFVLGYSVIEHFMEFGRLDIDAFVDQKLGEGRWVRYLLSRIVGGLFYGMIMAYFFETKKHK